MLRRNLIAIIIVTLGLVMATNTFGQERGKRPNKNNPDISRQDAMIKPMYVANQEEYMAGGIADVRGGVKDRGEETARRKNNSTPKPNAGFMDYTDDAAMTQIQAGQNSGGTISNQRTKSNSQNKLGNFEIQDIKSPRDVATGQVMNKNCQEFESVRPKKSSNIQSPRDVASGQATGIKSNAAKQPAGLINEISFPKEVKHKNSKWELGEYDASKNKSAKPKGSNLGDTATHERKRKGQN